MSLVTRRSSPRATPRCCARVDPYPQMLCRVDGPRVWADAFAAGAMGDELSSPRALVWSYSSPVVLRALSEWEESVAMCSSVIFSDRCSAVENRREVFGRCFATEVIVSCGKCFSVEVAWTNVLLFGGFHLRLHFTPGYQRVELFCIRFSYLELSCGWSPTLCFLLLFVLSLVIHRLLVNSLFWLLYRSIGSPT